MSEKITACENVCEDFSWASNGLPWLGDIITGFGPVLALLGAIYLFYKKASLDLKERRRENRREAYVAMFDHLNLFTIAIVEHDWEKANECHLELHIKGTNFLCFAEEELIASMRRYVDAVQDYYPKEQLFSESDPQNQELGETAITALDELRDARKAAIKDVRICLFPGNKQRQGELVDMFFPSEYEGARY